MFANYLQVKQNQNKGVSMYFDGRPKEWDNIVGFINSTQPRATNKQSNFIFKGCKGNRLFVWIIKSIVVREDFLISYNHNRIDTNVETSGVVHITFHQICNQWI